MNDENTNLWQLASFAEQVGPHYSTINNWFRDLENRQIHYVERAADGKKVYDDLDLKVAQYIQTMRTEKKWSLVGIYDMLKDSPSIELRPFPVDYKKENVDTSPAVLEQFFQGIKDELIALREMIEIQHATTADNKLMLKESEDQQLQSQKQKQEAQVSQMIIENEITTELTIEALEQWSKLPAEEREIRKGFFGKQEDSTKREQYVQKYRLAHYADRLKKKMNLGE